MHGQAEVNYILSLLSQSGAETKPGWKLTGFAAKSAKPQAAVNFGLHVASKHSWAT